MTTRRHAIQLATGTIVAGALHGCGGSEDVTPAPPPPQPTPTTPPQTPPPSAVSFPLRPSSNGRHLVDANGNAFFMQGDAPWAMAAQLTDAQIDRYLADRAALRFSTLMFLPIEHGNSSQSPIWNNADAIAPFTSMSPVNWVLNDAYWRRVDYIVNQAKGLNMLCVMSPLWFGFRAQGTGWLAEMNATADSALRNYGTALATRFTQGNVIWSMGGDYAGTPAERDRQWLIVEGMRTVRTTDLITAHPERTEDTHAIWNGYPGFNLNNIYTRLTDHNEYGEARDAYQKPGPIPFFNIEGLYENEGAFTLADGRRQAYVSVLSGAFGFIFGNNPLWGFGDPRSSGGIGAAEALNRGLNTAGARDMATMGDFFRSCAWHLLQPRVDSSFVTTSLGSGNLRIAPAVASDGSIAMIWSRGVQFTVMFSVLASSSIRARWFDPEAGTYATVSGSPFPRTAMQSFTPAGDRILVLDPV